MFKLKSKFKDNLIEKLKEKNHDLEVPPLFIRIGGFIKSRFLAGLLFLTPLALTVWILYKIFVLTDRPIRLLLQKVVEKFTPLLEGLIMPGMGLVTTVVIIFLVGVLGKNVLLKFLHQFIVGLIRAIPFASKIYTTIFEITHSIMGRNRQALQRALLVEYPRKDSWVIAFQTAETQDYLATPISGSDKKGYVNLFVPTTPNPTSGFMIMVPADSVRDPGISVEEAVKIIISGGAFDPRH